MQMATGPQELHGTFGNTPERRRRRGSASPNPAVVGQSVTYSVTASGSSGTPTGNVIFDLGDGTLCTATLVDGSGSCISTVATAGADTVNAYYSGDSTDRGATDGLMLP